MTCQILIKFEMRYDQLCSFYCETCNPLSEPNLTCLTNPTRQGKNLYKKYSNLK